MPNLEWISGPVAEPVSLSEIKSMLRVDYSSEDSLLTTLQTAARQWAENYTGRLLATQQWRWWLDAWPDSADGWWDGRREGAILAPLAAQLPLPRPPLQSINQILIYAADDSSMVWPASNYGVDNSQLPGRLWLRTGQGWPTPGRPVRGIAIEFTAGHATLPAPLRAGLLQLVQLWFANRGTDSTPLTMPPLSITQLFDQYRVRT